MQPIPLLQVDALEITTLVDNTIDALLPQQEGIRRRPFVRVKNAILEGGEADATLTAEHGFSAIIKVTAGGQTSQFLFDAGLSPDGLISNMDRLQLNAKDIEAVVLRTATPTTPADSTACPGGSGVPACRSWRTARPTQSAEVARLAVQSTRFRPRPARRWRAQASS